MEEGKWTNMVRLKYEPAVRGLERTIRRKLVHLQDTPVNIVANRSWTERGADVALEVGVQTQGRLTRGFVKRHGNEMHRRAVCAYQDTLNGAIVALLQVIVSETREGLLKKKIHPDDRTSISHELWNHGVVTRHDE